MVEEHGQNGNAAEEALTVPCIECRTPITITGQWAECPKCDLILVRGKEQGTPFAPDPFQAFTRLVTELFEQMKFEGPEVDEPEGASRAWISKTLVKELAKVGRKALEE